MLAYLDCSDETSEIRDTSGNRRGWLASEIKADDWVVEVTAEVLGEIDRLAEFLRQTRCRCCSAGWMNLNYPPAVR